MKHTFLQILVLAVPVLAGPPPDEAQRQVRLAHSYIQQMRETTDYGYLSRAQKLLDQVLAKDPAHYEALSVQNELDLFAHRFNGVIGRAGDLVKRNPNDASIWAMLGDAYMETGRYDEAERVYQTMVNLQGGLMSYNRVAWFRYVTGDLQGAIEMMTQAVNSGRPGHENTAWCAVELGNLYLKAERLDEAESAYRFALHNFARSHAAFRGLGQVAMARGRAEDAVTYLKKAQSMAPLVEYTGLLAGAYRDMGKPEEERRELELLEVTAKMEAASGQKGNRQLAMYWADHGYKLDEALEIAAADLAVRKDVFTWDAYAWVLFKNGRIDEAEKAMENALRLGTPEPLFAQHAAEIAKTRSGGSGSQTSRGRR